MAWMMGQRLVLEELTHPDEVVAGADAQITSSWLNRGIAPLYHDYRVTYRLRSDSDSTVLVTDTSLEGFLPTGNDPTSTTARVAIADTVAAGDYTLDIALAHVDDLDLKVPIAVTDGVDDGWYEVGELSVAKPANGCEN